MSNVTENEFKSLKSVLVNVASYIERQVEAEPTLYNSSVLLSGQVSPREYDALKYVLHEAVSIIEHDTYTPVVGSACGLMTAKGGGPEPIKLSMQPKVLGEVVDPSDKAMLQLATAFRDVSEQPEALQKIAQELGGRKAYAPAVFAAMTMCGETKPLSHEVRLKLNVNGETLTRTARI